MNTIFEFYLIKCLSVTLRNLDLKKKIAIENKQKPKNRKIFRGMDD